MEDGSFLRVLGPLYFIATMLVVFIIVVAIFSKKAPNKDIKRWSKSFLREFFWRKHLHGLVYILFFPVFLLGIYNMRLYSYLGTSPIQVFSILNTYIFMILFLVITCHTIYRLRTITKDYPVAYLMLQKAYNFILLQKTVLI